MSDPSDPPNYYQGAIGRGGRFTVFQESLREADLDWRIAEAQQRVNMAEPGDWILIESDLLPYINQTEK
jgi:hypothetical protein